MSITMGLFEEKCRKSIRICRGLRNHKDKDIKLLKRGLSWEAWSRAVILEKNLYSIFVLTFDSDVRKFNRYFTWFYERMKLHNGIDVLTGLSSTKPKPSVSESVKPKPKRKILNPLKGMIKTLKGCDPLYNKAYHCMVLNEAGIILAGYHGLGKSEMCKDFSKFFGTPMHRVQITEMTSDIDLVGSVDPNSGNFLKGVVYSVIEQAQKDSEHKHVLLLDEFTRGRDSALEVIFPLIAEKRLVINNPHCEVSELEAPDNLIIMATGNIEDRNLREVGDAEFDRWQSVEFKHIQSKSDMQSIVSPQGDDEYWVFDKLWEVYLKTLKSYKERRILAMSTRGVIRNFNLAKIKIAYGLSREDALKEALGTDYYTTSQAIRNPTFKATYESIMRECDLL